jgi:hypothetical protein
MKISVLELLAAKEGATDKKPKKEAEKGKGKEGSPKPKEKDAKAGKKDGKKGEKDGKHKGHVDKILNEQEEEASPSDKKLAEDTKQEQKPTPKGALDSDEESEQGNEVPPEDPLQVTSFLDEKPTYVNPLPKIDLQLGAYTVGSALVFQLARDPSRSYLTISRDNFFPFISSMVAASKSGLPIPMLLNGQKYTIQSNPVTGSVSILLEGATLVKLESAEVDALITRFITQT